MVNAYQRRGSDQMCCDRSWLREKHNFKSCGSVTSGPMILVMRCIICVDSDVAQAPVHEACDESVFNDVACACVLFEQYDPLEPV